MCNCSEAAINHGYIIRGGTYDETSHDFVDTDDYCMPLQVRDERGRFNNIKLDINYCPICGVKLTK